MQQLVIKGGSLASKIAESVEQQLTQMLNGAGLTEPHVLSVKRAFPNSTNIVGLRVGTKFSKGQCKLFVGITDEVLECRFGPKNIWDENVVDLYPVLTEKFGKMPEEIVPPTSKRITSSQTQEVIKELHTRFAMEPFAETALKEIVDKRFSGKSRGPFIGNFFRCGYLEHLEGKLARVTPFALVQKFEPREKKRRSTEAVPPVGNVTAPTYKKLIENLLTEFGEKPFGPADIISGIKKLLPDVSGGALGGLIGGMRKQGLVVMDGEGKTRTYRIPTAAPSQEKTSPADSLTKKLRGLREKAKEYETLTLRRAELEKELLGVDAKLQSLVSFHEAFLKISKIFEEV